MRETWYVLEDGNSVDPNEVAPDEDGKLMHTSGVAVAMRGDVPMSRGVDPEAERAKVVPAVLEKAADGADKATSEPSEHGEQAGSTDEAKDMKPETEKRGYKTRESKAD